MKILKIIGIILLVVALAIIGFILSLKGEGHLERSITINAPAEKVFMVVNDMSHTKHWSPWFKIDPNTKFVYTDNTVGVGAKYSWDSEHPDVMSGEQEITESKENEYVKTRMAFGGMTGKYIADIILQSTDSGTLVTWTYGGKAEAVMEKFFIDYMTEDILGPSYEEGLVNLKGYVEGIPDPEPEVVKLDAVEVVDEG